MFNFTCVFTVLETRVKLNINFTRPQAITHTNSQFGIFRNCLVKVEGLCKKTETETEEPEMTESGNGRKRKLSKLNPRLILRKIESALM